VPRVSFIRIEAGDVAQWYSTCLAMLEALDQIPSILGVGETVFQGQNQRNKSYNYYVQIPPTF
jgi:hypothetical protein